MRSIYGVGGLIAFATALSSLPANADITDQLGNYVGYTIVADKTVKGWVSEDGTKSADGFEGCESGRKIIFTDNTYLTCKTYHYHYSYRPRAIILYNGNSYVMLIDDDEDYEMRR